MSKMRIIAALSALLLVSPAIAQTVVPGGGGSSGVTSVGTSGLASGGPITGTGTVTVTAASKAQMEAGSATNVAVTPGVAQYAAGVAKAYVRFNNSGTNGNQTLLNAYNVASVNRTGTGTFTVTFTTSFIDSGYACTMSASGGSGLYGNYGTVAAGSFVATFLLNGSPSEPGSGAIVCFGGQ